MPPRPPYVQPTAHVGDAQALQRAAVLALLHQALGGAATSAASTTGTLGTQPFPAHRGMSPASPFPKVHMRGARRYLNAAITAVLHGLHGGGDGWQIAAPPSDGWMQAPPASDGWTQA